MNKFLNNGWNLQKSELLMLAKMFCKKLLKSSVINPRKGIKTNNKLWLSFLDAIFCIFDFWSYLFLIVYRNAFVSTIRQLNVWFEEVVIFMTLIYISNWSFKVSYSILPFQFSKSCLVNLYKIVRIRIVLAKLLRA